MGNVPETGCADAVHACLVLLDLLEFDANGLSQLLLGGPIHPPTLSNAFAYMDVNWMFHRYFLYSSTDRRLRRDICHKSKLSALISAQSHRFAGTRNGCRAKPDL
jgi:hypothetical protein